jgi:hypothetical protein
MSSHPFGQMVALADLFGSGALDGGLRVALVEAGCGWIAWFLDRLQESRPLSRSSATHC